MKKIAVIMSVYKNDKLVFLKEAIESILNQTYTSFDLFIQCDGVIRKECRDYILSLKDKRVHFRERIENRGLALSLKELLSEEVLPKKYEYIARMDADDVSTNERFEKQIKFLIENLEIDAVGTWIAEIDDKGSIIKEVVKYPLEHNDLKEFFKKRTPIAHVTAMFRYSFFEKVGNYEDDLPMAEDILLWYKGFLRDCKLANIDHIGVLVRRDAGMYKRRADWDKAIKLLKFRLFKINRDIHKGVKADFYTIAYFLISISPSFVKKIAYKILR